MKAVLSTKRFIALMACLMGLTAVGIDAVLPIFPEMIDYYRLPAADHNQIQQVVFMYMMGFSLFQLLFGVLADTLGRKPILLFGIVIFTLASLVVVMLDDFQHVLIARFIQGAGLAAPRVLTMTVIRDVASGREMSRMMSLVVMIFLSVPAVAPVLGQIAVAFAPWQSVFVLMAVCGIVLLLWTSLSLPETLAPEARRPLSIAPVRNAIGAFLGSSETQVYLLVMSLLFASLMTYLGQSEQILQKDIYQLNELFPLAFGAIIIGMIAAAITNARTVVRLGMYSVLRIGLSVAVVADAVLLCAVVLCDGVVPLWMFIALLMLRFFGFGLSTPNLNALALEPYRAIAGTASALIGTITSLAGVVVAQAIGYFYAENLYAMSVGFVLCTTIGSLSYALSRRQHHKRKA